MTYCYDGTTVSGSNCAAASYPNALGHLTQVSSSTSTTTYSAFDSVGRVLASSQLTAPTAGAFQLAYDFDVAGRVAHVKNPNTNVTYADLSLFNPGAQQYAYAPHGAIQTMALGSGTTESWTWDPVRLQPTQVQQGSLLTLQFSYCPNGGTSCGSNNGNIMRQTITTPTQGPLSSGVTQNYTYTDGFGRLNSATETPSNNPSATNWQQSYSYDSYGNRAVSGYLPANAQTQQTPTALSQYSETVNGNTVNRNHWTGAGYDAAGNITSLPLRTFTFDAENRITGSGQPGMGAIQYVYDGDGRRVQKSVGSAVTTYVYDAAGELAAEYGPESVAPGTTYVTVDQLGSTRLLQEGSGISHYDYLPFGEDLPGGIGGRDSTYAVGYYPASPDQQSVKFTGKERDAETGLDYFGARYLSSGQGRFTSPDEPLVDQNPADPQTWNLYSYVRNNPLSFVDLDGQKCVNGTDDKSGDYCIVVNVTGGKRPSKPRQDPIPDVAIDSPFFPAVVRGVQQSKPAVDLAGKGLTIFLTFVSPPAGLAVQCVSEGCGKGDVAMAFLPEVEALREGGALVRAMRGVHASEIIEKAGGFEKALEEFATLKGAETTIPSTKGTIKVKELSDGSKAVVRSFSRTGPATLEIQHLDGTYTEIRYK